MSDAEHRDLDARPAPGRSEPDSTELAVARTRLADRRTALASERTLFAVLGTGLATATGATSPQSVDVVSPIAPLRGASPLASAAGQSNGTRHARARI